MSTPTYDSYPYENVYLEKRTIIRALTKDSYQPKTSNILYKVTLSENGNKILMSPITSQPQASTSGTHTASGSGLKNFLIRENVPHHLQILQQPVTSSQKSNSTAVIVNHHAANKIVQIPQPQPSPTIAQQQQNIQTVIRTITNTTNTTISPAAATTPPLQPANSPTGSSSSSKAIPKPIQKQKVIMSHSSLAQYRHYTAQQHRVPPIVQPHGQIITTHQSRKQLHPQQIIHSSKLIQAKPGTPQQIIQMQMHPGRQIQLSPQAHKVSVIKEEPVEQPTMQQQPPQHFQTLQLQPEQQIIIQQQEEAPPLPSPQPLIIKQEPIKQPQFITLQVQHQQTPQASLQTPQVSQQASQQQPTVIQHQIPIISHTQLVTAQQIEELAKPSNQIPVILSTSAAASITVMPSATQQQQQQQQQTLAQQQANSQNLMKRIAIANPKGRAKSNPHTANKPPPPGSVNFERSYQICQAVIQSSPNRHQLNCQLKPPPPSF